MHCILTQFILGLVIFGKADAQAEELLELAACTEPVIFTVDPTRPSVIFDYSGNLWVVAEWGSWNDRKPSQLYASRIGPTGKVDLNSVSISEYDLNSPQLDGYSLGAPMHSVALDSWGNLYLGFAVRYRDLEPYPNVPGLFIGSAGSYPSTIHLARLSAKGEIEDFYPWPQMELYPCYIEVLPGDTIILLGMGLKNKTRMEYDSPCLLSKALVDSTGLTPLSEKLYPFGSFPRSIFRYNYHETFARTYFDWHGGYGFYAEIVVDSIQRAGGVKLPPTSDELTLFRFDLRASDNSITEDSLGTFEWRNYVWRTYTKAWIGGITFARYKDGGYLLCIPDPVDYSKTHVLRLNQAGEPVPPSELEDGGTRSGLAFDRMPSSTRPYAEFQIWNKPAYKETIRDSAQVIFWGCDEKGNLYTFRKVRKY